jgi:hypothetical protein
MEALHHAAERAVWDTGVAEIHPSVTAALHDGLTYTTLKAVLLSAGHGRRPTEPGQIPWHSFRLPLAALKRDLIVEARLLPRPRFTGADARIEINGSASRSTTNKIEQVTGNTYAVKLSGPAISGGPTQQAGHTEQGERHHFGSQNVSTGYERPLYLTDAAQQLKQEATLLSQDISARPSTAPPSTTLDENLTRGLEFDVQFRFIASRESGGPAYGRQIDVYNALVIRMSDKAAAEITGEQLPQHLREAAITLAKAGDLWTAAVKHYDGLAAQPSPDPEALTSARNAVAATEEAWWASVDAYTLHADRSRTPTNSQANSQADSRPPSNRRGTRFREDFDSTSSFGDPTSTHS